MARTAGMVMKRVVNPAVSAALRSPAHDLVGDHVALLHWAGRRSGRTYDTPVNVVVEDDVATVVTRRDRQWWRNLTGGAPVRLALHGRDRRGTAWVLDLEPDARAQVLGRVRAALGHPVSPERAVALARDAVVVRVVLDPDTGSRAPALRGRPLWRRWTAYVTVGETLGFFVPALVAGLAVALGAPDALVAPLAVLAGVVEGTILGIAQALVVTRALPAVSARAWVRATALGAAIAWAIGSVPLLVGGVAPALAVPGALVMVLAMGALQARTLRGQVDGPWRWTAASAIAWLAGLAAFAAVTSPLWHEGQAAVDVALVGALGGLVMAATVASLGGMALAALIARPVTHRIRVVRA